MEKNELVAVALAALTARSKYQTPASVKFEDGQDRSVIDITWRAPSLSVVLREPISDEVTRLADAVEKAAENPGKTFEVEQ